MSSRNLLKLDLAKITKSGYIYDSMDLILVGTFALYLSKLGREYTYYSSDKPKHLVNPKLSILGFSSWRTIKEWYDTGVYMGLDLDFLFDDLDSLECYTEIDLLSGDEYEPVSEFIDAKPLELVMSGDLFKGDLKVKEVNAVKELDLHTNKAVVDLIVTKSNMLFSNYWHLTIGTAVYQLVNRSAYKVKLGMSFGSLRYSEIIYPYVNVMLGCQVIESLNDLSCFNELYLDGLDYMAFIQTQENCVDLNTRLQVLVDEYYVGQVVQLFSRAPITNLHNSKGGGVLGRSATVSRFYEIVDSKVAVVEKIDKDKASIHLRVFSGNLETKTMQRMFIDSLPLELVETLDLRAEDMYNGTTQVFRLSNLGLVGCMGLIYGKDTSGNILDNVSLFMGPLVDDGDLVIVYDEHLGGYEKVTTTRKIYEFLKSYDIEFDEKRYIEDYLS